MSVYTDINRQQLLHFLSHYPLGQLIDFRGIQEGIENTNYRVNTTHGHYIVTIFEQLTAKELPFFFKLLQHLYHADIPCPQPQPDHQGNFYQFLSSKPIAIFNCLQGKSVVEPTLEECTAIGFELGKIHDAGLNFPEKRINLLGDYWLQQTFLKLKNHLSPHDQQRVQTFLVHPPFSHLPRGLIHTDLFKDNVLLSQHKITGVLDFYLACEDDLLLDLAITVNDWCYQQGRLQQEKMQALTTAYQQQRSLTKNEKQSWGLMLQKAALIFWLLRLDYAYNAPNARLGIDKDPNLYRHIFIDYQQNIIPIPL